MQKVSELKYERLSMEEFAQEIKEVIHQVKTADSARAVLAARDRCNQLMIRWETAQALSYMRYSINTADAFYLAEKEYYDEVGPQAQNYLVQRSGVVDNVIVDVFPVCVGGNDKSVFALGKPHGKFIAHLVGFLGGDLSGLERLTNLIGDHIAFLPAPGDKFVLAFGEHKFFIHGQGTAFVTADQFALLCLVRVLGVICSAFQAGRNRLAFVFVQRNSILRRPPRHRRNFSRPG